MKTRKNNQKNHSKNIKIPIEYIQIQIKKDDKTNRENFKIICWLCTKSHKISDCKKLKNESTEYRRNLVKEKKTLLQMPFQHTRD